MLGRMGTLYRKYCPACDGSADINVTFDGFVGAAIADSQRGGEIVSGGHVAYIADTGELVPLPHPIESDALAAAGGTWTSAAIRGRLIYIHNLICTDCGSDNTTASLHTGGTGCTTGLALAAIAIACNVLLFNFHAVVEMVLIWTALFVPSSIVDRYVRIRYRDNATQHQTTRCAQCGSDNLVSLGSSTKVPLPCPRCNQRTMRITVAGRS